MGKAGCERAGRACSLESVCVCERGRESGEHPGAAGRGAESQPSFSGLKKKMVAGQRGALLLPCTAPVASGRDGFQLPGIPLPADPLSGGIRVRVRPSSQLLLVFPFLGL